jgi:Zn-dependent protease with chaperone function
MSFLVIVSGWIVMTILPFSVSPNTQAIAYLLWSVPTILWMLVLLLRAPPRPEVSRREERYADQPEARPAPREVLAAH